jgi:hypothetical protein
VDTGVTEIRRKSFLEEDDAEGNSIFWSADPLEWSPIGNEGDGSTPLTAADYLGNKPLVPEGEPQEFIQVSEPSQRKEETLPASGQLQEVTPPVPENEKGKGKFGKKLLPILVIILLLIGLIGALLSTFLFPGPSGSGSGAAQPTSTVIVGAPLSVASPVNKGATPIKNMSQVVLQSHVPGPEV